MQSTLKKPAPAMRPKVGRPPVAEVLDHPMASTLRSRRENEKSRVDPRFALLAVSLIVLITLTLGSLLTPAPQPAPVLAATAPPKPAVDVQNERGSLVGDFAVMRNPENAVTYSQPRAVISDKDRQRILSILSKD